MGEALKANTTLRILSLSFVDWGTAGVWQLAEALKANCSLVRVTLATQTTLSSYDQQLLLEALQVNSSIKMVQLLKMVSTAGASHLGELLRRSATITALCLADLDLDLAAAEHLASALKVNRTLSRLTLDNAGLCPFGAKAIFGALKTNGSITAATLSDNGIGTDGAAHVAKVLRTNRALTSLNLPSNKIGSAGGGLLMEALRFNRHLTKLDLALNEIEECDLTLIPSHLEKSKNPPLVLTARVKRAADESAVHMHFRKMSAEIAFDTEGQEALTPNLTCCFCRPLP